MKIGILGTRGIPNAYGGFEQFAQYLAKGLLRKGHSVYVYNSSLHPYQQKKWEGVNIIHCRDHENRIGTAGQFLYDYNCLKDARNRRYDILLQLGYTSNSIWHAFWPKSAINIINMDGLEWMRTKYGKMTRKFLKKAEYLAAKYGDVLIADSIGIKKHLHESYSKDSVYIPYGAEVFEHPDVDVLAEWSLKPKNFLLLIARMEPENNIEMVLQGYSLSEQTYPLILVGNPGNSFGKYLAKKYSNPNIRFVGAIFEKEKINNIRYFSSLYFHGHSVGGTNPSLLEAMACGCSISAHDNIFNRAILEDAALYFTNSSDIRHIINQHFQNSGELDQATIQNLEKIKTFFAWEKIINDYERVFLEACKNLHQSNEARSISVDVIQL